MKQQQLINNWLIGSDIEFFVKRRDTAEIITAEGIVKGTKDDPFMFDPNNKFFATSLDCVLMEGNIPPAKTPYEFYRNVNKLIKYMKSTLPENVELVASAAERLNYEHLMSSAAQTFGCQPSLNCWTGEEIHPEPTGDNLRAAGMHIHYGYENPTEETNILIGKAMDLHLGIASVLIEPENERKASGYGCAGNIRFQKHGGEYRSLSGYFASSKNLIEWCFRNARTAINFVNKGKSHLIEDMGEIIQKTINTTDKETAYNICQQFNIKIA